VNMNLAPVVDTGSGAAIRSRSYGDDSALVAPMGAAAIGGFEEAGVVSTAKHFPNHGPAVEDSHVARPIVDHDIETVLQSDLAPFRAAVEAGVPMVMTGHLVYPAVDPERPASLSPTAVGLLRDELGFDGVIVTDDLIMEGARRGGTTAEAALRAVEAGVDLLIISGPPEEQAAAYDGIVAAVESGEIPRERIDTSVERIERVRDRYQIFGEVR
jgi:beta-N-acetylhexosaminidase